MMTPFVFYLTLILIWPNMCLASTPNSDEILSHAPQSKSQWASFPFETAYEQFHAIYKKEKESNTRRDKILEQIKKDSYELIEYKTTTYQSEKSTDYVDWRLETLRTKFEGKFFPLKLYRIIYNYVINLPFKTKNTYYVFFHYQLSKACKKEKEKNSARLGGLLKTKKDLDDLIEYKAKKKISKKSISKISSRLKALDEQIRLLGFSSQLYIYAKSCVVNFPFQEEKKYLSKYKIPLDFTKNYPL